MPIVATNWTRLIQPLIARVPDRPGVYELANVHRETIFISAAPESLQRRLGQHLYTRDACLARAWHFRYEETPDPATRVKELLDEYRQTHGQLPACNQRH